MKILEVIGLGIFGLVAGTVGICVALIVLSMTSNEALIFFVVGFVRAAVLTLVISIACYWGYDLIAILLVGAIGGVMTMKQMEKQTND